MTQTASSKDHFFSKSTEDEKHSEGELRKKKWQSAHWLYARSYQQEIILQIRWNLLMIVGLFKFKSENIFQFGLLTRSH